MALHDYRTLGRSGLAVSPFGLGTMTFGTARWGSDDAASREVFNAYVEAGGNFIDTADVYSGGRSEAMVGAFVAERDLRDSLVLATKAGFAAGNGPHAGPHAGGNGAKHLRAALEGSLRRLRTDYVDLFWIHVWDGVTPAEELLETMATLVRAGKIRYWGMSNSPVWYIARLVTMAQLRGLPGPIALQYYYSLANRDIESEFVPLAAECGMGIVPWSPLAFGLLTGKYERAAVEAAAPRAGGLPREAAASNAQRPAGDKRLDGPNPFGDSLFTERNWKLVDVLKEVAADAGHSPASIAYAWLDGRPGVSSTLLGVSSAGQLTENVAALDIVLSDSQRAALDAASAGEGSTLYSMFLPAMREQVVFGGSAVRGWRE
jgi:aryl-alcohol dehydrogenase-like predicted oxidoreductase